MPALDKSSIRSRQLPGFGFYLLVSIVLVVCLQGIIYLELVGSTIGPFWFFRKEKPPDPALVRELNVALLRSDASARMFPENPEIYYAHERHWENLLRRQGTTFRVVSDRELATSLGDAAVLVLPAATCLDEPQRKAVTDFLQAGKGVIVSGALGTRNGNCVWQGWEFLNSFTGIRNASTLTPSATIYVGFAGQLFFSERVPTGYRLEIPSQEITVATADQADAFWSDWMLRPARSDSVSDVALAVHGSHASGRIVWYGFNEDLPVERAIDQAILDHYLSAALRWVGKQPMAVLGNWPKRNRAAVLVAQDIQQDYTDAGANASLLKQEGVPAIFLCDSSEAEKHPIELQTFRSEGEVASLGDTLEPFGGQLPLRQAERLRKAKQSLEGIAGGKVLGFAPPQGLADTATVVALHGAGYRYYLNEMSVTRAVPEIVEFTESVFFPFQKSEFVKLFRTSFSDFEVIANYGAASLSPSGMAGGFLTDFHRILSLGGVYTFYFHSYLLGAPELRPVVKVVVDNFKTQPVWITTGQDLVNWWLARDRVQVQASKLGTRRIRLDVANMGQVDVRDASVYLFLPYSPKKVRVSSIVFRLQSPQSQMLDHDNILRLDFSNLSAQTNYTYLVGLDEGSFEE